MGMVTVEIRLKMWPPVNTTYIHPSIRNIMTIPLLAEGYKLVVFLRKVAVVLEEFKKAPAKLCLNIVLHCKENYQESIRNLFQE